MEDEQRLFLGWRGTRQLMSSAPVLKVGLCGVPPSLGKLKLWCQMLKPGLGLTCGLWSTREKCPRINTMVGEYGVCASVRQVGLARFTDGEIHVRGRAALYRVLSVKRLSRALLPHTICISNLYHRQAKAPSGVLPRLWPIAGMVIGVPLSRRSPDRAGVTDPAPAKSSKRSRIT